MKHGLCKGIVALFLMAAMLVGASALAERVIDGGLTDAQEVVKEVGEVDLYAPVVYAGTEQADAGEKDEQSAMEHNAEYYYEINSTFPDAVFRQYIRQYYDWDGDGYLSDEECEAVTCIDVENMGIKSLEGIYVFENLQELWCRDNKIEGLDVSYNSSLEILICSSNNLTSLFLPEDGVLENLSCYDNQLTWLDLSQSDSLKYLEIYHNNIKELDISACDTLIDLMDEKPTEVYDSDLDYYFIWWVGGGNSITELIGIDKDTYIYDSNEILYAPLVVEINIKHFPADDFRDYVLEECDANEDEWLDVEEIASVTEITLRSWEDIDKGINEKNCSTLKGIEYFTNLMYLECPGCKIKTLNVSKNKNLYSLFCYDNRLTKLDVSQNTKLETLSCSDNKLKKLILGSNKKLETLYAEGNKIKAIDIKNCPKLRQILKKKKGTYDDHVEWSKKEKDGDYYCYLMIDKKTKLTAGSKVLYPGK